MDRKRPNPAVVIKYVLLQLPGQAAFVLLLLLMRQWLEIACPVLWGLFGLWVSKDIILFFFLWRFYDPRQHVDRFQMIDRHGVALSRLDPGGYVMIRGERWRATIAPGAAAIEKGAAIRVTAADGLRLTVDACPDDNPGV